MSSDVQIQFGIELLAQSNYAVALTGAGISTPSGIPDFRSPGSGMWMNANPFEVASIYTFTQRPQDFYDWIYPLAKKVVQAEPNAAHLALAQLEMHGLLKAIITQNIDMLHSKAGSETVHEVHGHLREVTCIRCYTIYPSESYLKLFIDTGEAPKCGGCGGVLKPNVILIGEQLPINILNQARKQAKLCDLILVAGSSLEMAPAGDLPILAVETGARFIVINLEPTHLDHMADVVIRGDVVDVLPELAARFVEI